MSKTASDRLQVAVVGVGRMGRHHARTYAKLQEADLVAVVDQNPDRAATIADEYGCKHYQDIELMLADFPDLTAASIAVPTSRHKHSATPLLERGIACLVEKPLAPTVQEAHELAELARQRDVVLQVGHTERFNPAVRAVAAMKIPPRFIEVHRVSPMVFRALDVGVVMDLMIHDLDIVLMLANSSIERLDATGVAVLGQYEDIANARIEFTNGCVANITASRLAFDTYRRLRLFNETAYVSLDYQQRTGIIISKSANQEAFIKLREQLASGADLSNVDYSNLVNINKLMMDLPEGEHDDPLTAELASFLAAVRDRTPPAVDGQAGYAAVEAAERVVQEIRSHIWEGLGNARVW